MIEPESAFSGSNGLATKKILVISDDEFVGDLITKVLTRYLGLEVFLAGDGSEGIAAALTGRYNGAIIDLMMQGTSGRKVIATIKTMLPEFPIIGMTSETNISGARQLGITTILSKPFKMTALIEGVTEVFGAENILSPQK
jgi:two-component system, OmpR family, response regulator